jgi:hypothetical protein
MSSKDWKGVLNIPHAHIKLTACIQCQHSLHWRAAVGTHMNYSTWYCTQQWHKCSNKYPWTLIVQDNVYQVCPKHLLRRWSVLLYLPVLVWTGGKHIHRAKSNLWRNMNALLHSNVKVVKHGTASRDFHHPKITTQRSRLARSWKVCFGTKQVCFIFIFFHVP